MTETKDFPTEDVLSAVTGYLATERGIGAIYGVLGWMTDGPVWTHQLPRIGQEAAPVVLKLHPELAEAYEEAKQITPENWQQIVAGWRERYGPTIAVPRMTAAEHERIDPLSELAEKVHPDRIVVVEADQ